MKCKSVRPCALTCVTIASLMFANQGAAASGRHQTSVGNNSAIGFPPPINPATLVADLSPGTQASNPSQMVSTGSRLFFVADDGNHGAELWTSDGTDSGTVMVRDYTTGPFDIGPSNLQVCGNKVIYYAQRGIAEYGVWASDGTAAGTVALTSLPGLSFFDRIVISDSLYSYVMSPGAETMFRFDCTTSQASVTAVLPISATDTVYLPTANIGSRHYFTEFRAGQPRSIWRSDGTPASTTKIWQHPLANATPPKGDRLHMTVHRGDLYVSLSNRESRDSNTPLFEVVFRIDGRTDASTVLLNNVPIRHMASTARDLLLLASDNTDTSVWRSDGTTSGTQLVRTLPGVTSETGYPSATAIGNTLYFCAKSAATGTELWHSDGTYAQTNLARELIEGPRDGVDCQPTAALGNQIYAIDVNGRLWRSDGTFSGTQPVSDAAFNAHGSGVYAVGSRVCFAADSAVTGRELWCSDSTNRGTQLLKDINSHGNSTSILSLAGYGDQLFFAADTGKLWDGKYELWKTADGISATRVLSALSPSYAPPQVVVDGSHLFVVNVFSDALWASTTPVDTPSIIKVFDGRSSFAPHNHYFYLTDRSGLWRSDGTITGTVLLSGTTQLASASRMISTNGSLYVQTSDLFWKVDDTPGGITIAAAPTPATIEFQRIVRCDASSGVIARSLYFYVCRDPVTTDQMHLWRTDGTITGTYTVTTILLSPALIASGNFATALVAGNNDNVALTVGNQLWMSDGTAAGTRLAQQFGRSIAISAHAYVGGSWFISSSILSGLNGDGAKTFRSEWAVDSESGQIQLLPDVPEVTREIVQAGDMLYFPGMSVNVGNELFRIYAGRGADLAIATPNVVGVAPGGIASAPIALQNRGAARSQPITVTAELAPGLTYVSDSSQVTATVAGNRVTWVFEPLGYLMARQFDVWLRAPTGTVGGRHPVTVTASAAGNNDRPGDNVALSTVMLSRQAFVPLLPNEDEQRPNACDLINMACASVRTRR